MGTLYVVSTPIGNLEDTSLRALRVLKEVSLIAAEDTRHTRKLLSHYNITTPSISYHQHSSAARTQEILAALQSGDVALVTDAGTPGLSDPGGELVAAAAQVGANVVAVPGASALLTLVASAGLPAARLAYLGFLPRKGKERATLIEQAGRTGWPFVLYESPQRLLATLGDLFKALGDRPVAVGRELTKLHEEVFRGTISAAAAHFTEHHPRGEFAVMVGAPAGEEVPAGAAKEEKAIDLDSVLAELRATGMPAKQASRQAALLAGVSPREAYNRLVRLEGEKGAVSE